VWLIMHSSHLELLVSRPMEDIPSDSDSIAKHEPWVFKNTSIIKVQTFKVRFDLDVTPWMARMKRVVPKRSPCHTVASEFRIFA